MLSHIVPLYQTFSKKLMFAHKYNVSEKFLCNIKNITRTNKQMKVATHRKSQATVFDAVNFQNLLNLVTGTAFQLNREPLIFDS